MWHNQAKDRLLEAETREKGGGTGKARHKVKLRTSPTAAVGKLALKKGDKFQIISRKATKVNGKADWIKVQKDGKNGFQGWLRESPQNLELFDNDGKKKKLPKNKKQKGKKPTDKETDAIQSLLAFIPGMGDGEASEDEPEPPHTIFAQLRLDEGLEPWIIHPRDLTMVAARTENSSLEAHRAQVIDLKLAQAQADKEHEAHMLELAAMDSLALTERLKTLYPERNADKIDTHQGNGVDDRDKAGGESKTDWKHRMLVEHSQAIAVEEKVEADRLREESVKAGKLKAEHILHRDEVGVHKARILAVEQLHEDMVEHQATTAEKIGKRHTWVIHGKGNAKAALRSEADAREIAHHGLDETSLREHLLHHHNKTSQMEIDNHHPRIDQERSRHTARVQEYVAFVHENSDGLDPSAFVPPVTIKIDPLYLLTGISIIQLVHYFFGELKFEPEHRWKRWNF